MTKKSPKPQSISRLGFNEFGKLIRSRREELAQKHPKEFSLRAMAKRLGVEPSYLSKVERGVDFPPSEKFISNLAIEIGYDQNILLAKAGKISAEIREIICSRPYLAAVFLKNIAQFSDEALFSLLRLALEKRGEDSDTVPNVIGRPVTEDDVQGQGVRMHGTGILRVLCYRCAAINQIDILQNDLSPIVVSCIHCGANNSL